MSEIIETTAREEMIRVENLSYFEEDRALLSSLSFSIPKGGVHGVLGPRGSGKGLLLSILAGCEKADEGSTTVHGIQSCEETNTRKKIGYVPKHPAFYRDMTVLEVLDFIGEAREVPADKRYRQIKEALELLELSERKNRLVSRLTPSETTRLSIAGALLGNPDVILLDDPFSQKDPELRALLSRLIPMLGRVKTVLLSGTDFKTIRSLCEDVAILADGKILAYGTFEELEHQLTQRGETASLEKIYESLLPSVQTLTDRKEELK